MLSQQIFNEYISELESYFGKKLTSFVKELYWQRLSKSLDDSQFVSAAANAIIKSDGNIRNFPSAEALMELGRGGKPLENAQAYGDAIASLPSEQMRMTTEECIANRKKLYEMCKTVCKVPKRKSVAEYEAIAKKVIAQHKKEGGVDESQFN